MNDHEYCNVHHVWGEEGVQEVAYADDIVILAPNPSSLHKMLSICGSFAADLI